MKDIQEQLRAEARRAASPDVEALTREAAARGLVDVVYGVIESPLGPLVAAKSRRGLIRLAYATDGTDGALEEMARRVSPRILESPSRVDDARRQLDEYFNGRRRDFELDLDWSILQGFTRTVLEATAAIPYGHVATYREVASDAGSPRAVRAAGNALGSNPIPIIVPCHRVLRTGGALGGYTGGLERKEFLLRLEGTLPSL